MSAGYIEPKTLKELTRLNPWRTGFAVCVDWAIIAIAIASSELAQNPLVYLLAILVIGGRMHALAVLVHDFAHYRFVANKQVSDWLGDFAVGWPILTTIDGYRNNHLAHHRHTNTEDDPDWVIKLGTTKFTFPQSWRTTVFNILGYFLIFGSLSDMAMAIKRLRAQDNATKIQKLVRLVFYVAILAIITLTGTWVGFLIYWVLPYFTIFFFLLYVRSVAEHFGSMDYSHELTSSRSVIPYFWEKWFFSPHNVNYHLEHHLYPSVPFYNLPALHEALNQNSAFAEKAHVTRGYTVGLVKECLA